MRKPEQDGSTKEPERYETPELRRYGRIEHITLQSPYLPSSGGKTDGVSDGLGPLAFRDL